MFSWGFIGESEDSSSDQRVLLACQAVPVQAHDPFISQRIQQGFAPKDGTATQPRHGGPLEAWDLGGLDLQIFPEENHRPWKILKSQSENCRESGLDSSLKKETGSGFGCCMMLRISAHRPISLSLSLSLADVHL